MKISAYCEKPFVRCRLTCEGDIAMCCHMTPEAHSDPFIGNVFEKSFDEIWFGERAESIRQDVFSGKKHSNCCVIGCPHSAPFVKHDVIYNEYPTCLEIDLPNTMCNIGGEVPTESNPACVMCERSSIHFKPQRDRLLEALSRVKNIIPNLNQIDIQGFAEPFHERLLFNVFNQINFDKYASDINLTLMTNGTLLDDSVRKEYFERVPKSVTNFSLDAATPEVYRSIRFHDFELVLQNLFDFSKERDSNNQFLIIHNNINTMNVHDVEGMVHIGHQANVEHVEFNPTGGHNQEIQVGPSNCGLFYRAHKTIEKTAKDLGVKVIFFRPLDLDLFGLNVLTT